MNSRPWITKIVLIPAALLVAVFFISLCLIWRHDYRDRIYPGVHIGNLDLGGKTLAETKKAIAGRVQDLEAKGLKFQYNNKVVTLTTTVTSFDSDLAYSALSLDPEQTALTAYGQNTAKNFFSHLLNFLSLGDKKTLKAAYTLNEAVAKSFLADNFPELNVSPENAYFSLVGQTTEGFQLARNPERPGREINYDQAIQALKDRLANLQNSPIVITTHSIYPTVKEADLAKLEAAAQDFLIRDRLILRQPETTGTSTSTESWSIKPEEFITWISVRPTGQPPALYLDQNKIKEYLSVVVAPKINREAVLPRFEIKDGRATSWQKGASGRQLDLDATAAALTENFLAGQNETLLITKETAAGTVAAENNFKITEIVGTGHSSFAGSPVNRRHNIAVGAAALEGLLIKPGEEFSLIKALGDVNGQTGYLPELVIKGNKTVPEFGGGLCQIGTTVFRTALASGLPITMRQNHSYRVSYYEPAGTDATIYIPQPDLRFINDTGNYILIQARIEKNDLYFDFWGTKDGRVATTTAPVIYNIVKPEPTKIVESEDLKPGEKKCTESSHNGADAYFDYTVTYPVGATTTPLQSRRFKSHYIPWQAVCLVGKTATSTASTSPATSTADLSTSSPLKKAAENPAASSSLPLN